MNEELKILKKCCNKGKTKTEICQKLSNEWGISLQIAERYFSGYTKIELIIKNEKTKSYEFKGIK